MFTHTLYIPISTQSRYLSTHKRPLYLSTVYAHTLSLYTHCIQLLLHSIHSLYLSAHTPTLRTHYLSLTLYRSLYTHSSLPLYTHCLSVSLKHFTFFNLALAVGVFLFFVYNVSNINFNGGLDALGISSVCSPLC